MSLVSDTRSLCSPYSVQRDEVQCFFLIFYPFFFLISCVTFRSFYKYFCNFNKKALSNLILTKPANTYKKEDVSPAELLRTLTIILQLRHKYALRDVQSF